MSTKPGAFALSKYATLFVFSNKALLAHHMRIILPLALLCDLAGRFLLSEGSLDKNEALGATMLLSAVTLFLYACFVLGWHRASLQGPDPAHERNPFNLDRADWGFVGLFMGVTLSLGLVMNFLNAALEHALETTGVPVQIAASVGALIGMAAILYLFLRASFLFPARSVGVRLAWSDTKKAARGLYWPLIGANIIFALIFSVAFAVYLFVVGFIASVATEGIEGSANILMQFALSIPITIAGLVVLALCVSALSHAYQWGIQNNA